MDTLNPKGLVTHEEKVWFLRGILVALAVVGHELTYDQIRRMMRLSDRQLGPYLGEARAMLSPGEPDICASVVKNLGTPGKGWGNVAQWAAEVLRLRSFWKDRADMDNLDFQTKNGTLPSIRGEMFKP